MAKHESIRIQQAAEKGVKAIDCIIEAVEAELALERELGVRLVEFDRTLLEPLPKKAEDANALVESMRPESVRAVGFDKTRNARIIATRNPTPNESRESIAKENAAFSGEVPEFFPVPELTRSADKSVPESRTDNSCASAVSGAR